ncbi:PEAR1-like protein [Mya arenaria]|uniref:PEAR1-like protein n=1 Tax=Mya arenaria TaxID=6604 RepID=A0ABY7F7R1_MYAAR|nr:PEAR1-like protein [Mya arenaria]
MLCAECLAPCTSCKNHSMCTSCIPGRFGQTCQHGCSQKCTNGICVEKNAICRCYPNYKGAMCDQCLDGRYGDKCGELCSPWCEFGTCKKETGFCPCKPGRYDNKCQSTCPTGCVNDICNRSDGSCHSCKKGYVGERCNITCPSLCNNCDNFGVCTECKPGYSNEQNQCTCKRDICVHQLDCCKSCTNTSFFANGGDCCLCSLDNCVSCSKALDTINCKICNEGYYPNSSGECELCNSQCVNNECDSSSGECYQGCTYGYWNKICDKSCDPECVSCSQSDGSCTQCKNNTKYGPNCSMECSTTCKKSMCGINGDCRNGCIINKFGKQCEQACENYCTQKENRTVCSEKTGMCLYGCKERDNGSFCPLAQAEKQMSTALLGGGVGGGVVALAAIVVVGLILLRRRRGNLSNKSERPEKERDNSCALYATVNKGRAHHANEDTDNLHSVTIIENTNYQSPPPKSSDKESMRILTENNLEIDADDVSAREIANMFETNDGVYYNNATEISKFKLTVVELPEYVQNICIKDLEEEFQTFQVSVRAVVAVNPVKINVLVMVTADMDA